MPWFRAAPAARRLAAVAATATLAGSALLACSPAAAFDVFEGRRVYEQHCANCHGFDGMAVVPGTPNFALNERLSVPDATLVQGIRAGRQLMPAYDRVLKDVDILNVISYIRTLPR